MAINAQRRPALIIFVYSWDILRSIFAFLAALTAFSGALVVGNTVVPLSLAEQIVLALSTASLGAALLLTAMLLTRHYIWVRRTQIVVFTMAIALAITSYVIDSTVGKGHSWDVGPLLVGGVFCIIDLAAITAMATTSARSWFSLPGPVPHYMRGLVAFWAATMGATIVLHLPITG